jgi:hypothetical protein
MLKKYDKIDVEVRQPAHVVTRGMGREHLARSVTTSLLRARVCLTDAEAAGIDG